MELGKKYSLTNESKFRAEHGDADNAIKFHTDMYSSAWTVNRYFTDEDNVVFAVVGNNQIAYLIPQDLWDCFGDYVEPEPTLVSGWEPATQTDLAKLREEQGTPDVAVEPAVETREVSFKMAGGEEATTGFIGIPSFTIQNPLQWFDGVSQRAAIYDMLLPELPKKIIVTAGGVNSWVHLSGTPEEVHNKLVKVQQLKMQLDELRATIDKANDAFNAAQKDLSLACKR